VVGEKASRQRVNWSQCREVGEDTVDEVGNSDGLGEVGDGDARLGMTSAVKYGGSRSIMYESAGGGWWVLRWSRSSALMRKRAEACHASASRPRWWEEECSPSPSTRCIGWMKAGCMART